MCTFHSNVRLASAVLLIFVLMNSLDYVTQVVQPGGMGLKMGK